MSKSREATLDTLARAHTQRAMQTIAGIMNDDMVPPKDRLRAAAEILDRGHGKPLSAVIQIPMNRQKAAQLATMTDGDLLDRVRQAIPDEPIDAEYEDVTPALVAPAPPADPEKDPILG